MTSPLLLLVHAVASALLKVAVAVGRSVREARFDNLGFAVVYTELLESRPSMECPLLW